MTPPIQEALLRGDAAHHLRPFADPRVIEKQGPLVIVRGEGCFVEDDHGRRYLDAMAGLWCVQVGYGQPKLVEAARAQLERLPYYNTFFGTTTDVLAGLVDDLRHRTPPGLDDFVFGNSGSEAIDTAVRLVRRYWQEQGAPERRVVIGRHLGYHGSTMVGVSVGGMAGMHAQGGLPLPDFAHIDPPYPFEHAGLGVGVGVGVGDAGEDLEAYGVLAAEALEAKIGELGAARVAAFVAEPVMGAGGVIVPPASYWPRVQAICRAHDVLLVADEVICGFGRTGAMFGSDTYGITPDLMTLAKGLTSGYQPMSAVALGPRVSGALRDGGVMQHGFTYAGHPVAAAVARANLALIDELGLVARTHDDTGPRLAATLAPLAEHPLVGEVRGVGLMAALELVRTPGTRERFEPAGRAAAALRDACLAERLIVRPIREGVALCPPLTIAHDEIAEIGARLARALDRADAVLRQR